MTAQQRPPVFELHIRPLVRLLDRAHMLSLVTPGIDLWDLDTVWAAREEILTRLRGEGGLNMPGLPVGGPWPAEWIALFERWIATGSDTAPGHHLAVTTGRRDYTLWLEPAFPGRPADPTPVRATEHLLRSEVERVTVRDADGTQELV